MAADRSAAFRAAPLFLFLIQEGLHPVLLDEFQVGHHAHMIFGAVPLIQRLQPGAGKLSTFKAKPDETLSPPGRTDLS